MNNKTICTILHLIWVTQSVNDHLEHDFKLSLFTNTFRERERETSTGFDVYFVY